MPLVGSFEVPDGLTARTQGRDHAARFPDRNPGIISSLEHEQRDPDLLVVGEAISNPGSASSQDHDHRRIQCAPNPAYLLWCPESHSKSR